MAYTTTSPLESLSNQFPSKPEQLIILAALSGARRPSTTQKIITNALSAAIKLIFFGIYLAQTLDDNPNSLGLAWTGALISGGLNAILGGSVDPLIKRLAKGSKSLFNFDSENLKENAFFILTLIPFAFYFGYAEAGPFGEGSKVALDHQKIASTGTTFSHALISLTVLAEGTFLTYSALQLFERIFYCCFKDKRSVAAIREAPSPLHTTLAIPDKTYQFKNPSLCNAQNIKRCLAFLFIWFAYANSMADATDKFLRGSLIHIVYDPLLSLGKLFGVPIGAALLNLPACYNYADYLLDGINTLTDPLQRLLRAHFKTKPFFPNAETDQPIKNWEKFLYWGTYVFTLFGATLAYSSSVERARSAGTAENSTYVDFCQTYLLVIMAFIVNAWAIAQLPKACIELYKICRQLCQTKEKDPLADFRIDPGHDFNSADLRKLSKTMKYLKTHPNDIPKQTASINEVVTSLAWAHKLAHGAAAPEAQPLLLNPA